MAHVPTSPTKARASRLYKPGKYLVEAARTELGTSPKGNTTMKLQSTILDGPEQEDGTSPAGGILTTTIYVADDSRSLKNALEAFGVDFDDSGWDSEDFVKKEAIAHVIVKMYEGEKVNNIRKFSKPDEEEVG